MLLSNYIKEKSRKYEKQINVINYHGIKIYPSF